MLINLVETQMSIDSPGALYPGLMKDHGQQARASENFAGPVDFETPRPDLPVHFLNFQKPWLTWFNVRNWFYMFNIQTSL